MGSFPDDASLRSLTDLGVNYVVVHTDAYPGGEWAQVEQRLNAFSSRLKLMRKEGGGRVYQLR
jgi:hypothetical protein